MIEVVQSPEWDDVEDQVLFAQFLRSRTGQRLIPKVIESIPALLAGGNVNEILIRSGEVRGWQSAMAALLALAVMQEAPKPQVLNPSYPGLADDKAWNDGQTVNPENPK